MGGIKTELKPRGWLFLVLVVMILLPFAATAWWLKAHVQEVDFRKFDWAAFGAFASGAAAVVSAIAGLGAVYAARVALSIDSQSAQRQRLRDLRNAVPLAHVLQFEMLNLRNKAVFFSQARTTGQVTANLLQRLHAEFDAPTLRAHLHELGCFNEAVGRTAARVALLVLAVRVACNPTIVALGPQAAALAADAVHATLEPGMSLIQAAEDALREYTNLTTIDIQ